MQPLAPGDPVEVGPYRLLGRLGAGGMGQVYLGRSPGGRTVAVKRVKSELASDAEFLGRFRREVEAARRVGGSWTAPVLDADTESAEPWVATGYVAGPALAEAVAEFGPLAEHGVRALVAGLAEALAAVHGLGLIHRDVKPSNVMLSPDGPVLIDFGIARALDGSTTAGLTQSGYVVGSPGYMSPEQVQGLGLGAASDVFQLGAVLVFAATGQGPFHAESAATLLYKVAHGEPELGTLQGELREIAAACLAKDPAARPTPAQLAARLAPQGARVLVDQGWLAAPLMARISRRMAELLNLDAAVQHPGTQRLAAVPVRPAEPPAHPPVHPPTAAATVVPQAPPKPQAVQDPEQNRVAELLRRQREREEAERRGQVASQEAERRRRVRMGLPADPPPPKDRTRSAIVITVGALLLAGGVIAVANMGGGSGKAGASGTGQSPSASPIVPLKFYGHWSGPIAGQDGNPAGRAGTMALDIVNGTDQHQAQAQATFTLSSSLTCEYSYTVRGTSDTEVELSGPSAAGSNPAGCETDFSAHLYLNADSTATYSGGDVVAKVLEATLTYSGATP